MFQEREDSITTRLFSFSLSFLLTEDVKYANAAKKIVLHLSKWNNWTDISYTCGTACLDTGHLIQVCWFF
jgi:hypothetical protein